MPSVTAPTVPFSMPMHSGFCLNSKIEVHGCLVSGNNNGFCIQLVSWQGIALYLNASPRDSTIHLRSMEGGCWQNEQKYHSSLLIRDFHLSIVNNGSTFAIYVDGHRLCDYKMTTSSLGIKALQIRGDIKISKLEF